MSDDNKPKGAPVEGRTQAFQLKIDGWLSELIPQDFDLEGSPPAAPSEPAIEPAPAPPTAANPPPALTPKKT